jgi:hypothetical protein
MERLTAGKRSYWKGPPGTVDPIFLHELALELHMPVREMCERMPVSELTRDWPLFFEWRRREGNRARERAENEQKKPRTFA